MPGPIDDTLKHLTELSPQDWVVRDGWPAAAAGVIDGFPLLFSSPAKHL
jgi:hypothetical protein